MTNWQIWMDQYGYLGVFLALFAHFIPTELIMSYAGFLVATNQLSYVLMLATGVIGFVLSQLVLYGLGYFGGERLLHVLTKWLHVRPDRLQRAEHNLRQYGGWYLLLSPLWKTVFAFGAGTVRIRLTTFLLSTALSFTVWSLLFMTSGYYLKERWDLVATFAMKHVSWMVVFVVLSVLVIRCWSRKRD
ncbi:DedA family protein [Exiguobacterium sp. H66]|uniref:DedA family protein n=1 Tax=Exiguobacterium sp. H66 TaxID=2751208 RepID=UPI001BE95F54|nr:DedA family protein [Exiguobacterium sp. H66]